MESVPEIMKYVAGGGGTLGLVFLLAKSGLLKLQIGANGNSNGTNGSNGNGYAKDQNEIHLSLGRIEGGLKSLDERITEGRADRERWQREHEAYDNQRFEEIMGRLPE